MIYYSRAEAYFEMDELLLHISATSQLIADNEELFVRLASMLQVACRRAENTYLSRQYIGTPFFPYRLMYLLNLPPLPVHPIVS
jgi:hypothetical protein